MQLLQQQLKQLSLGAHSSLKPLKSYKDSGINFPLSLNTKNNYGNNYGAFKIFTR